MKKVYAVILGGGIGSRSKSNIPKQFLTIGNKTVLEITIEKFNDNKYIDEIILVVSPDHVKRLIQNRVLDKYKKLSQITQGGKTRRESANNGLKLIEDDNSKVLIHDAVRPFVSHRTINRCIDSLETHKAVYPAVDSADTLVHVNNEMFIENIPMRKYMMRGQTPQGFWTDIIKKAHLLANDDINVDQEVTNDCGLIKRYNLCEIKVIEGNRENKKITHPEDLMMLEELFKMIKKHLWSMSHMLRRLISLEVSDCNIPY